MRPAGALPLCYAPAENVAAQVFPVSGGPVRLCLSHWRLPDKKEVPMQNKKCLERCLELIRDNGLWTLEDAVYRLTGMPSEVYGLPMIGKLKEGLNADITVFDYKNVRANADYDHPFRKNNGIEYVIVNGKTAVKNGEFTGVKNGKVLRMKRER